jgi:hypothetical protein
MTGTWIVGGGRGEGGRGTEREGELVRDRRW